MVYKLFSEYKFTWVDGVVVGSGLLQVLVFIYAMIVTLDYIIKGNFKPKRPRRPKRKLSDGQIQLQIEVPSVDVHAERSVLAVTEASGSSQEEYVTNPGVNTLLHAPVIPYYYQPSFIALESRDSLPTLNPGIEGDMSDTSEVFFGEIKSPSSNRKNQNAPKNNRASKKFPFGADTRELFGSRSSDDDSVFCKLGDKHEPQDLSTFKPADGSTSTFTSTKSPNSTHVQVYDNSAFDYKEECLSEESFDSGRSSKHESDSSGLATMDNLRVGYGLDIGSKHPEVSVDTGLPITEEELYPKSAPGTTKGNKDNPIKKIQSSPTPYKPTPAKRKSQGNGFQIRNSALPTGQKDYGEVGNVVIEEICVDTGLPVSPEEIVPTLYNSGLGRAASIRESYRKKGIRDDVISDGNNTIMSREIILDSRQLTAERVKPKPAPRRKSLTHNQPISSFEKKQTKDEIDALPNSKTYENIPKVQNKQIRSTPRSCVYENIREYKRKETMEKSPKSSYISSQNTTRRGDIGIDSGLNKYENVGGRQSRGEVRKVPKCSAYENTEVARGRQAKSDTNLCIYEDIQVARDKDRDEAGTQRNTYEHVPVKYTNVSESANVSAKSKIYENVLVDRQQVMTDQMCSRKHTRGEVLRNSMQASGISSRVPLENAQKARDSINTGEIHNPPNMGKRTDKSRVPLTYENVEAVKHTVSGSGQNNTTNAIRGSYLGSGQAQSMKINDVEDGEIMC